MANIRRVQALAPIVTDLAASARFYQDALGMSLQGDPDSYLFTSDVPGLNHFGLWRLTDAARSCWRSDTWPSDVPRPQLCVEFDVEDLGSAMADLEAAGCQPLQPPETQEEWGTTVVRYLSPEGLVLVLGHTPPDRPLRGS